MRAKVHRDGPRSKANPVLSTLPSPMPRRPSPAYAFPKIPGTANLLIESYRFVPGTTPPGTLVPPLLSSQPPNFGTFPGFNIESMSLHGYYSFKSDACAGHQRTGRGGLVKQMHQNQSDTTATCKSNIGLEQEFFLNNFKQKCGWSGKTPDTPSTLFAVYGWVPISFPLYPAAGETPCQGRRPGAHISRDAKLQNCDYAIL